MPFHVTKHESGLCGHIIQLIEVDFKNTGYKSSRIFNSNIETFKQGYFIENAQNILVYLNQHHYVTHNHWDVGEREPVDLRPDREVAPEVVPLLRLVLHRLAVVQPLHVVLLPLLPEFDEE